MVVRVASMVVYRQHTIRLSTPPNISGPTPNEPHLGCLVLTRFDGYPIHQVPLPVAHPATSDRNFYDRYFFHGYRPEGEVFFGAAMGLYPNRRVIDAAFSVVHNGRQKNLYASGRAPSERSHTT
jgi:hypothetical protein